MYRLLGSLQIAQKPPKLWEAHENDHKAQKTSLWSYISNIYWGLHSLSVALGTPKLWAIAHENIHKTRERRVFGHSLKHVSGIRVVVNRPETPILWIITHENDEFRVIKFKIFSGLMVVIICLGTPKLWTIDNEKG